MIIVDKALAQRAAEGRPVRVGVVGAGFAGRGVVYQIVESTPGMKVVAVANRTIAEAARAFTDVGHPAPVQVDSAAALDRAVEAGNAAITDDFAVLCAAGSVDVVVEATGEIIFGAEVAAAAIANGKHLCLLNAELDATLGPVLKYRADRAGVVYTGIDGDQPGVLINLAREAKLMGFEPVVMGNIKSLLDHYRTPKTQEAFAKAVFQRPKMITSFADGTKISVEMALVSNATGFGVTTRGMEGPPAKRVEEAVDKFPAEKLYHEGTGIVDYILGAEPSFGVFVLAYSESNFHQQYMKIYKMGEGPIYTFYRPFHLSPLEVPTSIARAALFGDAVITPEGAPVCDVVAVAKKDLTVGEELDGVGGYACWGDIENSDTARQGNLVPMGLTDGMRVVRDVPKDQPLTLADVEFPEGRLADALWREQNELFATVGPRKRS